VSALASVLLPALLPAVLDAVRGAGRVIAGKLGGAQPASVGEVIQLADADTRRLQALAALDQPGGTPSQWVIDLRASARYVACFGLIGYAFAAPALLAGDADAIAAGQEMGAQAFAFLFGDRIYANLRGRR